MKKLLQFIKLINLSVILDIVYKKTSILKNKLLRINK